MKPTIAYPSVQSGTKIVHIGLKPTVMWYFTHSLGLTRFKVSAMASRRPPRVRIAAVWMDCLDLGEGEAGRIETCKKEGELPFRPFYGWRPFVPLVGVHSTRIGNSLPMMAVARPGQITVTTQVRSQTTGRAATKP